MELFKDKKYTECVTFLLNKEFSRENTLLIAKSLQELGKHNVSLEYFMKIIDYFSGHDIEEENATYFVKSLYLNEKYDMCNTYALQFLKIFDSEIVCQYMYGYAIESQKDNVEPGYQIVKECFDKNLLPDTLEKWSVFAKYAESIGDKVTELGLYKKYNFEHYKYIITSSGNLEFIYKSNNTSVKYLALCHQKKYDEYEKLLLEKEDYPNLALFYANYLKQPEKALLFSLTSINKLSELIELFLNKKYKEFLKFLVENYEKILQYKNILIYDCTAITTEIIIKSLFPNGESNTSFKGSFYKLCNITTIKFMKGVAKYKLGLYSSATHEFRSTLEYVANSQIYLTLSMCKDGDFFGKHKKYLEDLPDTSITKKNLIDYYLYTKQLDKMYNHLQDYIGQSPNNFSAYYGITDKEIDFFARNKYGVLPLISLLYCINENPETCLLKLIDINMITKNNKLVSILEFANCELNTEYQNISEMIDKERMNSFVVNYLNENV